MNHFAVILSALLLFSVSYSAEARNCGKVHGQKIVTYGGLSCGKAKSVYTAFQSGKIPKGWNCGLSAGECDQGYKGFTFRFN